MRKRKAKRPENHVSYLNEGYGLWEVWEQPTALGEGSARPVMHGMQPRRFLLASDADWHARILARAQPDMRFKVVLTRGD